MKDKLHQALTALLIMVPGTISLSMGNTSIMPYKGCAACPPGEIACLPTQKVLILHAVRVFKYICSCKGMPTCDAPCCNDPGGSCTHEYSDSEVRDLQESCQDTHTCLVRALQGTTHCGEKEFYVFSLLDYMCVDRPAAQVSNETSVQGKIVYVELANRNGGYEKTTCVAESQSKENLQISFVIVNWRPGTQVAVNLGEVTHELSQRKTKYSVTSPETLSFAQLPGNAEVTLWAIIEGEDSEVSVNCTREVIPVPKGLDREDNNSRLEEKVRMVDTLHVAMIVLLVTVRGTDSLIMGTASIKWHLACSGCEAQEVTCPPTQKVLILQAERAFKFLASCSGCDPACCEVLETDCLKPYSDSEVRDLLEACQDTHTCLVQDKKGTGPCSVNNQYVYSRVNYTCVDGAADEVSKEKSVQGRTVYVELAGRNRGSHQQRGENTTCIAESGSKESLHISFVTLNLSTGAQVVVQVGETTRNISQRNTKYGVTSPETYFAFIQGNAEVTVWAIVEGQGSEVNVTCTSHARPQTEGERHLVGFVVAGVSAGVVGMIVLVLLALYIIRPFRRAGGESSSRREETTGNLSSEATEGREYAAREQHASDVHDYVELQTHDKQDYLHAIPEPQTAAGSASTAASGDQPYERLDQASRDDNVAAPYQTLGPASTSNYVNTV